MIGLCQVLWQIAGGGASPLPDLFFPGYISHRADNELTVVARAQGCFAYDPGCLMVEVDYEKPFRKREDLAKNFHEVDRELFEDRFASCFDGPSGGWGNVERRLTAATLPAADTAPTARVDWRRALRNMLREVIGGLR